MRRFLNRFPLELLLVALIAASYAHVSGLSYAYDDGRYILETPQISRGLNLPDIMWAFTTTHASNWHPMTWISYMVDTQLSGMNAAMFHFTNLLLHILAALVLFTILKRLTGSRWKSLFVAALFGIHPLHVESVAWIAERKDVLSTLFGFITLWAYIDYVEKRTFARYLLVLLFFILGLMSKPMLVTLPFTLLLLDYWPLGRLTGEDRTSLGKLVIEKIPFFVLTVASCIVTYSAQKAGGAFGIVSHYPLQIRLMNAVYSYAMYIWKMLWPMNLAVCYPHPGAHLPLWKAATAGALLVVVSLLVVRARTKRPYLLFGWLWYLITLVPVIGIVQVGNQAMADRYTYVPLIGLFIIIAWGISDLLSSRSRSLTPAVSAAAVLIVLLLAGLTRVQVSYWQNNYTLFKHASEAVPNNAEALSNYGAALRVLGKKNEALVQYKKAVAIDPNLSVVRANLGGIYHEMKRDDEAVVEYEKAIKLNPNDAGLYVNLAVVYAAQSKYYEAQSSFDKALSLNPDDPAARNEYGNFLSSLGRQDEALAEYDYALAVNPDYADAFYNKGVVLQTMGQLDQAAAAYMEAIRCRPEYESAWRNLAVAQFMLGRYQESWAAVHKVLDLGGTLNRDFLKALSEKLPDPGK